MCHQPTRTTGFHINSTIFHIFCYSSINIFQVFIYIGGTRWERSGESSRENEPKEEQLTLNHGRDHFDQNERISWRTEGLRNEERSSGLMVERVNPLTSRTCAQAWLKKIVTNIPRTKKRLSG